MALLIAGLALFIAFAALWLANSALGKVEAQFQTFSQSVIKEAKQAKKDMETQVGTLNATMQTLERKVETHAGGIAGSTERIKQIEHQLISSIREMREIEAALPPQYRRKKKQKPAPAEKAS